MSSLTDPLVLPCGRTVPNRVALAPLTNLQSNADGTLGEDEFTWLLRRAEGGFGWVSTCAAYVSAQGKAWPGQLGVAEDAHLPGLTRLASALATAGAMAVVQLHHGGAVASEAPARISAGDGDGVRAATPAELRQVVEDFVAAALRAEAAGFAGVELHGANGYLFTQFLAPGSNPRTDQFGGDLAGRALLLRQTLQAVRAAVDPGFVVGVRLSPVDLWARRGLVLADSVQLGRWLAEDGADFIHLSLREATGTPPHEPAAGSVARAFREALPAPVALLVVGGVWTPADAGAAQEAGADVVVLGRAGIAHPSWPRDILAEGFTPLRPPWSEEHLREVGVGAAFSGYLARMAGMVQGGTPARS